MLSAAREWVIANGEQLLAYGVVGALAIYVALHPETVIRAVRRKAADEVKALTDLWSAWFDLLMVSLPAVWNFAQSLLIKVHGRLDGHAPAPDQGGFIDWHDKGHRNLLTAVPDD